MVAGLVVLDLSDKGQNGADIDATFTTVIVMLVAGFFLTSYCGVIVPIFKGLTRAPKTKSLSENVHKYDSQELLMWVSDSYTEAIEQNEVVLWERDKLYHFRVLRPDSALGGLSWNVRPSPTRSMIARD